MGKVRNYLSLIKFSHTIFAMPFALIGFFLGMFDYTSVNPDWHTGFSTGLYNWNLLLFKFILVILCMVFARSAAMSFNRYLDREFDAKNPRTAIREIPTGILGANNVLIFTIANCVLFIACCFFINRLCFLLSPVALLIILGYSYTKRFTVLCHLILGLGLSLAPIGAYLAVTAKFDLVPVLFSLAVLSWVSGFDIIYALQDDEFDRAEKLFSIPASLGRSKALSVSEFLHLISGVFVILAGLYGSFGWLYWLGVAVFLGMLLYQHIIVKPNDLRKVNLAFMTANGIASIVFAVFVIADLFINNH
jgi:4-hydroxybenzoate polyprenyltransferase